jgi:microcystin degradation protein MlrC
VLSLGRSSHELLSGESGSSAAPIVAYGRARNFTILRGEELTSSQRFAFLKKYPVSFIPTVVAQAVPGGPVEKATYDAIKADFLKQLQALLPLDGLFLPMHGAMFVDGMQDAEGDWMKAARKVVGPSYRWNLQGASHPTTGSSRGSMDDQPQ